jgi:sugar transferase (PEP-CTERM system associated)
MSSKEGIHKEPSHSGGPARRDKRAAAKSNVRFFSRSTEVFRHHIPTEFILLGLIELIALVISFYLGTKLRLTYMSWGELVGTHKFSAIVFGLAMLSSLIAFGAYQRQSQKAFMELAIRIASSLLAGLLFLSLTYYVAPMFFLGRGALALAVLVSFISIMVIRILYMRIMNSHDLRLRVLILGDGKIANLVKLSKTAGEMDGLNIIDYMPMPGDIREGKGITLVNTQGALAKYVAEKQVDVIVLAMDERRKGLPVHDLLDCKMGGVEVIDLATFFERHTGKIRLDIVKPSWLFLSDGFKVSHFRRTWKRIFDIATVLILSLILSPLVILAVTALLIEGKCKAALFYTQTRIGEYGRPFQIYKFRSMVADAEQDGVPRWAEKNDSRITRVGSLLRKFRIDEIPQLYNILKGDMSFVGPRPERPEFVQRLAEKIPYYDERHRLKPGLSGWAQICYPYGASAEDGLEKLQYDLYYVKNYSILLDALILLQTAEVVLLGRGAH